MTKADRNSTLRALTLGVYCLIVCGSLLGAVGWYWMCDWVSNSTMTKLPGATRSEVRELLGEPTNHSGTTDGDVNTADRWYYMRPGRWAEFRVDFDSDGRVDHWSYDR